MASVLFGRPDFWKHPERQALLEGFDCVLVQNATVCRRFTDVRP